MALSPEKEWELEQQKLAQSNKLEQEKLQWEKEKLKQSNELEQQKLAQNNKLEQEKLQWEKIKLEKENGFNFKNVATGITILVSVLVLGIGWWADRDLAEQTATNDFQLKAAEIVMDSDSELETYKKAQALKKLFANRLPENFSKDFLPADINTSGISQEGKVKLFDTLTAANQTEREQILQDWAILWPGTKSFIEKLKSNQVKPQS